MNEDDEDERGREGWRTKKLNAEGTVRTKY